VEELGRLSADRKFQAPGPTGEGGRAARGGGTLRVPQLRPQSWWGSLQTGRRPSLGVWGVGNLNGCPGDGSSTRPLAVAPNTMGCSAVKGSVERCNGAGSPGLVEHTNIVSRRICLVCCTAVDSAVVVRVLLSEAVEVVGVRGRGYGGVGALGSRRDRVS
jgi:hypothetical protein